MYAEQLERWFEHFPVEQFLILDSAEFFSAPERSLQQILDFVGASPWSPSEFRNYSYTSQKATNPDIPQPTAAELAARFAAPNRDLEALLGVNLDWGD
jgi:hypothetical protein